MNLQQLYYFCTIVNKKTFSKASESLNVTQSTLSHSIKDLEKELNAPLFYRSGKGISLTPFGQIMLDSVAPALEMIEDGKSKIRDLTDPESGMVSVSYLSSLNDLITYALSCYYTDIGRIQSHFRFYPSTTTEIEYAINSGTSDLAFTTEENNPAFDYFPIGHHETVLIVNENHPLARYDAIHLLQIRDEKLITYEYSCQIRRYIDKVLTDAGISPKVTFETTNDNIIISSVAANFGVALIPAPLNGGASRVKIIHILDKVPPRSIALARKKSRYLSKAAESFSQYILKNTDKLEKYLSSIPSGTTVSRAD